MVVVSLRYQMVRWLWLVKGLESCGQFKIFDGCGWFKRLDGCGQLMDQMVMIS